jgi:transcriptional regulatory protein LevR
LEPEAAERLIALDIEAHFHDFVDIVRRRYGIQRQELGKLVASNVIQAVEKAMVWAEGRLRRTIPERTLYALALHISSNLDRLRQGKPLNNARLFPTIPQNSFENQVAAEAICLLSKELGITFPHADVGFLTLLLRPEEETRPEMERVGIVVLAHGRGVAAGMVEVAHSLTGMQHAIAIDMDLDEDPAQVQEQLIHLAASHRFDGGLLCLADMGSLESIGQEVMERTGLPVRTIGMISPPK